MRQGVRSLAVIVFAAFGMLGMAATHHASARRVAACQDAMSQKPAASVMPLGVSCSACMHDGPAPPNCNVLARAPVIAVVSGAHQVDVVNHCAPPRERSPGDALRCWAFGVFKFTTVRFLHNPGSADAVDRFSALYRWDERDSELHDGVFLRPDRTYLLYAGGVNPDALPKSRWYVAAACEVPADASNAKSN